MNAIDPSASKQETIDSPPHSKGANMNKSRPIMQFAATTALHQSMIAIVLIAGFPLMATLYMGTMIWLQPGSLPMAIMLAIFATTIILAGAGFVILLKFPKNIMRLRQHIAEFVPMEQPSKISLINAHSSDDLRHIESDLNAVLHKMRQQVELAELNQRKEHWLREKVEDQHRTLVQAERHRAMIQSLGAACHHLGQPVTSLKMRLYLMKEHEDLSDAERAGIMECEQDLDSIEQILDRLRTVSQFRTEPYIGQSDDNKTEILAI